MKEPYWIECVVIKKRGKKRIVLDNKKIDTPLFRPSMERKIIRHFDFEEGDEIRVQVSPSDRCYNRGMILF